MIAGSTFPPIMYGYFCDFIPRTVILSIVTVAAVFAFILTLIPGADGPGFRTVRSILFFITGTCAAVPIIIATISTNSVYYWVAGHLLYTIGVIFYGTRIPERYAPGKFDYLVIL